jgi:predicted metal-binding membrane protein
MRQAASARDLTAAWRRVWWYHPELRLAIVAVAAWMALFALTAGEHHAAGVGVRSHHGVSSAGPESGHAMSLLELAIMTVAMMLPAAVPVAHWIALRSKWSRRHRALALFGAAFAGVWVAAGAITMAGLHAVGLTAGRRWHVAAALVLAALWELTAWKRWCLRSCHRVRPIPPTGWRADWGCVRHGVRTALPCLGSCWAMMAPILLADHIVGLWLMMIITPIILLQRQAVRPARAVRPAAAVLTVLAVVVAVW